ACAAGIAGPPGEVVLRIRGGCDGYGGTFRIGAARTDGASGVGLGSQREGATHKMGGDDLRSIDRHGLRRIRAGSVAAPAIEAPVCRRGHVERGRFAMAVGTSSAGCAAASGTDVDRYRIAAWAEFGPHTAVAVH